MKTIKYFSLLFIVFFISLACMWDSDTIEMETRQFPGTLELITGKFLRHSDEFHEWRIQDRLNRIKQSPDSIKYYDDLAVSYSKLKRDKEAIEIMIEVEKLSPNRYETQANLGTFYIHDGDLKNGINHINKALEINPEAHFGRERYQKYLAEYLLSKQENGKIQLPLSSMYNEYSGSSSNNKKIDFYNHLLNEFNKSVDSSYSYLPDLELNNAIEGIKGMMKFGNFNSPVLLECIGNLLSRTNERGKDSPRNIVSLAYFNASNNVSDAVIKNKYLQFVRQSSYIIEAVDRRKINIIEQCKHLNEKGEEYFRKIRQNELKWIADSTKNPEIEFAKMYYGKDISQQYLAINPESDSNQKSTRSNTETPSEPAGYDQLFMFGFLILGALLVVWKFSKNHQK